MESLWWHKPRAFVQYQFCLVKHHQFIHELWLSSIHWKANTFLSMIPCPVIAHWSLNNYYQPLSTLTTTVPADVISLAFLVVLASFLYLLSFLSSGGVILCHSKSSNLLASNNMVCPPAPYAESMPQLLGSLTIVVRWYFFQSHFFSSNAETAFCFRPSGERLRILNGSKGKEGGGEGGGD